MLQHFKTIWTISCSQISGNSLGALQFQHDCASVYKVKCTFKVVVLLQNKFGASHTPPWWYGVMYKHLPVFFSIEETVDPGWPRSLTDQKLACRYSSCLWPVQSEGIHWKYFCPNSQVSNRIPRLIGGSVSALSLTKLHQWLFFAKGNINPLKSVNKAHICILKLNYCFNYLQQEKTCIRAVSCDH